MFAPKARSEDLVPGISDHINRTTPELPPDFKALPPEVGAKDPSHIVSS